MFLIPICRQCGDKWQSKTLFLLIFDLRSSVVLAFSIAAYPLCKVVPLLLPLPLEYVEPESGRSLGCLFCS